MENIDFPIHTSTSDLPPTVYIAPERIMAVMATEGGERLRRLNPMRVFALAVLAGGFITIGALFSVLLAAGSTNQGVIRLLEGLGFSTGFFFVILSHAVLFTEANVVMPATAIHRSARAWTILRFWGLAWVGNFVGAFLVANLIYFAQEYSPEVQALIREVIATKMSFREVGGAQGATMLIVSGVLANWLVGMAAFFATMGRTIIGKYIPVFLAVTVFVAANFQHSPANMGFFSLAAAQGDGPGWTAALLWNIIPAGIGNIIGGSLLVAALMSYAFRTNQRPT